VKASSIIGILTAVCAVPGLIAGIENYRNRGTVNEDLLYQLGVVPITYLIVRHAERRMREPE